MNMSMDQALNRIQAMEKMTLSHILNSTKKSC